MWRKAITSGCIAAFFIFTVLNGVDCAFQLGTTLIALGYNVSVSDISPESQSTVIIDGITLPDLQVAGYYVTLDADNCTIRFELWEKLSDTRYKLWKTRIFTGPKGYSEVPLPDKEKFRVTPTYKLGFSSLIKASICVGYLYVTNDSRRSQTRRHFYKNNPIPSVGSTYDFNPYQTTFLFPIGIVMDTTSATIGYGQKCTSSCNVVNGDCFDDSRSKTCRCLFGYYRDTTNSVCASVDDLKPVIIRPITIVTTNSFQVDWSQPIGCSCIFQYIISASTFPDKIITDPLLRSTIIDGLSASSTHVDIIVTAIIHTDRATVTRRSDFSATATTLGQSTSLISGQVTCDNKLELYADGLLIISDDNWQTVSSIRIPSNTHVIGMKCTDIGDSSGIIGFFNNNVKTDSSWKCANFYQGGWDRPGFDDSSWSPALVKNSSPWSSVIPSSLNNNAEWIWTVGGDVDDEVYCRKVINASPTNAPSKVTKRFIGYSLTTDTMGTPGQRSVIHHGLQLEEGTVVGFRYRNSKLGCRVRLQIWRNVNQALGRYNYSLIYQQVTDGATTGVIYLPLPKSEYFEIMATDKLGFTTEDGSETCVSLHYVMAANLRSSTVNKYYPTRNFPKLYETVAFSPFQTTYIFGIEVEILVHTKYGVSGPQGLKGIRGRKGVHGTIGNIGLKGEKGSPGLVGNNGEMGNTGVKGERGFFGDRGKGGSSGKTGEKGQSGTRGHKGDSGIQGAKGDPGLLGARGEYGDKGPFGRTGITGVTGDSLRGLYGETGVMGPIGSTGLNGRKGGRGLIGPAGRSGPGGPVGAVGPMGLMWTPYGADYCSKSSLNCDHLCVNTDLGANCGCRPGYELIGNQKCTEINECIYRNGECQYDCVNTAGSYYCACPVGLRLSSDTRKCNDFDECTSGQAQCTSNQICINLWNDYYCAGPFVKKTGSKTSPTSSALVLLDSVELVTRDVMIGLLIWLIILTILTTMAAIMMIPECQNGCTGTSQSSQGRRPQFYYPAFFPRVSLDRRPSSDRIDIIETRQSRNSGNDNEGIVNQEHIHESQQRSEL